MASAIAAASVRRTAVMKVSLVLLSSFASRCYYRNLSEFLLGKCLCSKSIFICRRGSYEKARAVQAGHPMRLLVLLLFAVVLSTAWASASQTGPAKKKGGGFMKKAKELGTKLGEKLKEKGGGDEPGKSTDSGRGNEEENDDDGREKRRGRRRRRQRRRRRDDDDDDDDDEERENKDDDYDDDDDLGDDDYIDRDDECDCHRKTLRRRCRRFAKEYCKASLKSLRSTRYPRVYNVPLPPYAHLRPLRPYRSRGDQDGSGYGYLGHWRPPRGRLPLRSRGEADLDASGHQHHHKLTIEVVGAKKSTSSGGSGDDKSQYQ